MTFVGSNAVIKADAGLSGNGGKVIVWSDDTTRFQGSISAKGGSLSGNGGFVETSGKELLNFTGTVNAGAKDGTAGTLLLDPKNIIVDAAGAALTSDVAAFTTNPSDDATIAPNTITDVTNTGTAVVLQANNDITVNSSIVSNNPGGNGGDLTFQAGRNITLNANINSDNGNVSFKVNDEAVGTAGESANRDDGAAAFVNNSLVDAGSGNASITMGTQSTSGSISSGQITANNFTIAHNGPTAGADTGKIDLGETEIANNMTITTTQARNVVNTVGTVIARNIANISTTGGDITITNANTDFNILRTNAANVTINDTNAMQIGTTVATGTYTLTTKGPMASYSNETMTVGGQATFTVNNGGFGYADPYINLPNNNDFQGTVVLNGASTGQSGTGGWATIKDINALTLGAVTLGSNFTVTSGASSAGALVGHSTITVPSQTVITAGSGNDVTLDDANNNFNAIRVISGNNATLVDKNAIMFGSVNGSSGYTSHIYGDLSLTAGGDISQYYYQNYDYSAIAVDGTTTFTANNASAPINLYLGPNDPFYTGYPGSANNFTGSVTLARNNTNTGFSNIQLRNTNSTASVLTGLTSVGTLNNVYLTYNNAPSLTLPGMTLSGSLKVYAPSVANTATTPSNKIRRPVRSWWLAIRWFRLLPLETSI